MVSRIAGTICLASALVMILWLASGATASGFVKFALLGIVGSILVLYKWDELVALAPNTDTAEPADGPDDGVFGTELPPEAFAEPAPEHKSVNLRRASSVFGPKNDLSSASVLVATPLSDTEFDADSPNGSSEQSAPTKSVFAKSKPSTVDDLSESDSADLDSAHVPIFSNHKTAQSSSISSPSSEIAKTDHSVAVETSEPIFIQLADYSNEDLVESVRAGEVALVSALTETGMLSAEGELTDTDVATMVFVAVSSDDLLRTLIAGKEAEAEAAALSYSVDTPQLYQPSPQLVEPQS